MNPTNELKKEITQLREKTKALINQIEILSELILDRLHEIGISIDLLNEKVLTDELSGEVNNGNV